MYPLPLIKTTDQNKFTKTSDKKDALYQKGKTASKEGVAVKEKMITRERKANDARTDYLLAIAAANAGIKNFFEIEMPSLVDSLVRLLSISLHPRPCLHAPQPCTLGAMFRYACNVIWR